MDFDYSEFNKLKNMLGKKAQFVPMDPASAGGDPAAMGGAPMDPAAMGAPMDPAAMGAPMDPSMMGGDPAAAGAPPEGGEVSPTGEPYMKITPTQLSKLFKQFAEVFKSVLGIQTQPGGQSPAAPAAPAQDPAQQQQLAELNAKLDALIRG